MFFYYVLLCVVLCHSNLAIILIGKGELVAFLCLPSWCLVFTVRLFLTMPQVCLQFVIMVFLDYTHLLFAKKMSRAKAELGLKMKVLCSCHLHVFVCIASTCDNLSIHPIAINVQYHSKHESVSLTY